MRSGVAFAALAMLVALSGCTYFKAVLGAGALGVPLYGEALQRHAQRGTMQDFALTMFDGRETMLSEFSGQPLVINFWADW